VAREGTEGSGIVQSSQFVPLHTETEAARRIAQLEAEVERKQAELERKQAELEREKVERKQAELERKLERKQAEFDACGFTSEQTTTPYGCTTYRLKVTERMDDTSWMGGLRDRVAAELKTTPNCWVGGSVRWIVDKHELFLQLKLRSSEPLQDETKHRLRAVLGRVSEGWEEHCQTVNRKPSRMDAIVVPKKDHELLEWLRASGKQPWRSPARDDEDNATLGGPPAK